MEFSSWSSIQRNLSICEKKNSVKNIPGLSKDKTGTKMKILYDYQQFTMQKYGGISRYLYEIITRIGKYKADEVKVLAGLYINQYLKNCDSGLVIGWQSPKIPKTGKMRKLVNYYLSRFWLSTHDKPDIIHETYYASKSVMSQPCPTVITVHDMIHEKLNSFLSDKAKRLSLVKVNAINRADHVICVSNQTKKDFGLRAHPRALNGRIFGTFGQKVIKKSIF